MFLTILKKNIILKVIPKPTKRRSPMKFLKKISVSFLFILMAVLLHAQQAEKTLVKSFNLKGKQVLVLDLDGDIEVRHWKNTILRVEMAIGIENGSNAMLKSLVTAGRYNLRSVVEDDMLRVYAPGMDRDVKIKGSKLNESITFTVNVPEDVIVKTGEEASSELPNERDISGSL